MTALQFPGDRIPPEPLFGGRAQARVEEEVTVRDVIRLIYRRRGVVLGTFLLTFTLITLGVLMLPRSYVAGAKLQVSAELQPVPSFFTGLVATSERRDFDPVARRLETQMELLETYPLLLAVVDSLRLRYDDVYHSPVEVLSRPLVKLWDAARVKAGWLATPPDRDGMASALGGLARGLRVAPVIPKSPESGSNLIQISVAAPTPKLAHDQLAVLIASYLSNSTIAASEYADRALSILDDELARAATEVKDVDARMQLFLGRAPGGSGRQAVGELPSFTSANDVESVTRLKQQLLTLQMELIQTRQVFKDSSERVLGLQSSIRSLEAQVAREVSSGAERTAALARLTRETQLREDRFNDLQRRRNEVALYRSVVADAPQGITVVEPPGIPSSWNWKARVAMIIGGGGLGLFLGLALASLAEFLDPILRSAAAVRRVIGLPVVARVPTLGSESLARGVRPDERRPGSSAQGDLQGLMQRLVPQLVIRVRARANGKPGGRVVVLTSAESGAGKTVIASSLARQLAQLKYGRVLLVDTDLTTPSLHHALKLTNTTGYAEALEATSLTAQAPDDVHDPIDSSAALHVMTAGRGAGTALALNVDRVRAFVDAARANYDWIIFDAGTITDGSLVSLQPVIDGLLVVVNARATRGLALRAALSTLHLDRSVVAGVVLNRVERELPDYLYQRV